MKKFIPILAAIIFATVLGSYLNTLHLAQSSLIFTVAEYVTHAFINLIKVIIAPLVFMSLVLGIMAAKEGSENVGRLFLKSLAFFISSSVIALLIGFSIVFLLKPGVGFHINLATATTTEISSNAISLEGFLRDIIPSNFIQSFYTSSILQIVILAILFGLAFSKLNQPQQKIVRDFFEAFLAGLFKFCELIMKMVPITIFCAILVVVTKSGGSVLLGYAKFLIEYYLALLIIIIVMLLMLYYLVGISALRIVIKLLPAYLVSFTTTSSEVAYPAVIDILEQNGIKNSVAALVMPLAYSFNMVGSIVYSGFAMVFIMQVLNISFGLYQYITMFIILFITSKGIAGIPRASLMVVSSALAVLGFPINAILILLPVDAFADMGRSAVNVFANSAATIIMDHSEKNS